MAEPKSAALPLGDTPLQRAGLCILAVPASLMSSFFEQNFSKEFEKAKTLVGRGLQLARMTGKP